MNSPVITPNQSHAPLSGKQFSEMLFNLEWWLFFNELTKAINANPPGPSSGDAVTLDDVPVLY